MSVTIPVSPLLLPHPVAGGLQEDVVEGRLAYREPIESHSGFVQRPYQPRKPSGRRSEVAQQIAARQAPVWTKLLEHGRGTLRHVLGGEG